MVEKRCRALAHFHWSLNSYLTRCLSAWPNNDLTTHDLIILQLHYQKHYDWFDGLARRLQAIAGVDILCSSRTRSLIMRLLEFGKAKPETMRCPRRRRIVDSNGSQA